MYPQSGNSGHVVVPKAWIGKEAIVTLKEKVTKAVKGELQKLIGWIPSSYPRRE
jgi:Putative transposon-encoded protein (DUF2080)